ncbi:MAG: SGNH/GDSL hydrolase family protein [Treponema sp.]|nr:SGNH/GDSL hydrolase family protein [Treponema sp.]
MKGKKLIGIIMGVSMTVACAFSAAKSNHPLGLDDKSYNDIMESSLVSTGNNYRLKNAIEKIKKGEKVTIAALGGSVTEGAGPANFTDGYAYQFYRAVKETYAPGKGENLVFDGAGLSGTPSQLGIVRYKKDVVDVLGQNPDILIIEFAVNDGGDDFPQRAFEALVRDALSASPDTAVIALYSAATYGNTAAQKKPIAEHYQIPQVDILPGVKRAITGKKFKESDYYTDNVHPTKEGHQLMAECLMNLFAVVDKASMDSAVSVPADFVKTPAFSGMKMITGDDENVKISAGAFNQADKNTQSIKKTNKGNFPQNWYKSASSKGDSFKMDITCKNLILTYKVQGSWISEKFGTAEVYVDGKKVGSYDGGANGGWCNCEPRLIIDEASASKHTVEVKMASGSEGKGFTIVCMGYSL